MTLLAAVDFSDVTERVVEQARRMAEAFGWPVTLLHAVQVPPEISGFYADAAYSAPVQDPRLAQELKTQAERHLQQLAAPLLAAGLEVQTVATLDAPGAAILDHAGQEATDLVVLGSHGHTGLLHRLLGGVAEEVIRRAPCPVLIVHSAPPEERQ